MHREEGDLGPVYGFQWRHFGAEYIDMHTDYTGKGVDQLARVIDLVKSNPNDRRIIMSAWNPPGIVHTASISAKLVFAFDYEFHRRELETLRFKNTWHFFPLILCVSTRKFEEREQKFILKYPTH